MKHCLRILLMLCAVITGAHAQMTTTQSHGGSAPTLGRDFWLAYLSHDWGSADGAAFMRLYITSPENTEVYIECNGTLDSLNIVAYKTSSYLVPFATQMESSGIVENKAIHVWSNTASLNVCGMNTDGFSTDGETAIPSIGWGDDYVVAGYASLFTGQSKYVYDIPSECAIVANQNNTTVTITPSCDCRRCTSGSENGDSNSKIVVYPAHVPQTWELNRGQSLELFPVLATDTTGFDLTGTIIHSNKPVGVLGGSMETNIPLDFEYANHVEEMIPPVRTWGETYMGTSFAEPPGSIGHDYACYLLISSKPNQTIFDKSCVSGSLPTITIDSQFGIYWDEEEAGQKFYSNAPFLCMEYTNSDTYPDGNNGDGYPAEGMLTPREQFAKTVVFQTPTTGEPYTSYVDIVVNNADIDNMYFDAQKTSAIPHQCIDSNWSICVINNVAEGTHIVSGDDSGVGVFVYGYGFDDTYSWGTNGHASIFNSFDTIPPSAQISGECFSGHVHVTDSGFLPNRIDTESGIAAIWLDSAVNMTFTLDTNWVEGSDADTSGYNFSVINPANPGILVVSVFDAAGNQTKLTSVFTPIVATLSPSSAFVGVQLSGTPPDTSTFTIENTGTVPIPLQGLHLLYDDLGFSLHDSTGGPLDTSAIPPRNRRLIEVFFTSVQKQTVFDSLILDLPCSEQSALLIGNGGEPDFTVTNQAWIGEQLPSPRGGYEKNVAITNFSNDTITIDHVTFGDTTHFKPVTKLPLIVPPYKTSATEFTIAYFPSDTSSRTFGAWTSPQVLDSNGKEIVHFDSLNGSVAVPMESFTRDTSITISCEDSSKTIDVPLMLSATGSTGSIISRVFQTNTTDFEPLQPVFNSSNNSWNPDSEIVLPVGQSATILIRYQVPIGQRDTAVDSVYVLDGSGDTVGGKPVIVSIVTNNVEYESPTSVNVGSFAFGAAPDSTSFFIQNPSSSTLVIDTVQPMPGNRYDSAFRVTTNPSVPDTLPAGGQMEVTVTFDPSFSDDPVQQIPIDIVSNACNDLMPLVTAEIANSSVSQTPSIPATSVIVEGNVLDVFVPTAFVAPVSFQLVDVLGVEVLRASIATGTSTLDLHALPTGVYFWRITEGGIAQNGKILLGE